MGITGTIQRYGQSDVNIAYEGTLDQEKQFLQFLGDLQNQGMIEYWDPISQVVRLMRNYKSFKILDNHSRLVEWRGWRGGSVVNRYLI